MTTTDIANTAEPRIFDLDDVNDYIDLDMTHSVHTSERRSFRGCRRRWSWLFREYYYPTTTAKPLEFGVAYHAAMEVFYEPQYWNAPRQAVLEIAIQTLKAKCVEQFRKYEEYHGPADPEVRADYKERVALGEGMLRYHEENVYPWMAERYKPLKVEVSFEVPIMKLDHRGELTDEQLWCKCKVCWQRFKNHLTENKYGAFINNRGVRVLVATATHPGTPDALWGWGDVIHHAWRGLPVTYGGRIDCVMEDLEDGGIWIFDWKTAAQLSEDRQEFLELDDQISSYVQSLKKLGVDVRGFVYFEQRKATMAEPEPMKVMRLGRRFTVSKQVECDAATYERTVSENDPEAYANGLYDDFISWLKSNDKRFHAHYVVHRNEEQLRQTELNIAREAAEITNPNLLIYPNAGRFNCMNCAFKQPCMSANDGGDYRYSLETQYEKRKYHYWVIKQPSTESKGGE